MAIKFVLKQNLAETPATENPTLGEYFFDGTLFTVGSEAANSLVTAGGPPEQFVIVLEEASLMLINRADGTEVNGQMLRREAFHLLKSGGEIRFGKYLIVIFDDALTPAATARQSSLATATQPSDLLARSDAANPLTEKKNKFEEALAKPPTRNFSEVLDALRTEEDSFYFTVKNGGAETARVTLVEEETPIGVGSKLEVAFSAGQISTLYAVARKDWSGILLESQKRNAIFVNDEPVETTRRLRNGDRVSFAAPNDVFLILHEPSSLVALESLLSARVAANGARYGGLSANRDGAPEKVPAAAASQGGPFFERRFFGFFSLLEIVTMVIATLIGAVLFFLFFEFVFS